MVTVVKFLGINRPQFRDWQSRLRELLRSQGFLWCCPGVNELREAEQTFEVMHENRDSMTRRGAFLALSWDERLLAMSSSLRQLAPVLAVRKPVLREWQV